MQACLAGEDGWTQILFAGLSDNKKIIPNLPPIYRLECFSNATSITQCFAGLKQNGHLGVAPIPGSLAPLSLRFVCKTFLKA